MIRTIVRTLGLATLGLAGAVPASAQFSDWDFQCIDPGTTTPYSNPFVVTSLLNDLMGVSMGVAGTVTYGDAGTPDPPGNDDIPCFTTTQTINVIGRFGFFIGPEGSIQDEFPSDTSASNFTDDFMSLTFGAPFSPGGSSSYVATSKNGTRTRFGTGGINLLFTGESNRYFRCQSAQNGIGIDLVVSVIGDAVQMSWLLTNQDAAAANIGLWFGAGLAMISNGSDVTGSSLSHYIPNTPTNFGLGAFGTKLGYVVNSSGGRPPLTEKRFRRAFNPTGFPQTVDYLFGQTSAYGMRLENGPTPSTTDNSGQSDATEANEFVQGQQFFLLGNIVNDNTFPDVIFPPIDPNDPDLTSDVGMLDNTGFIQKFPEQAVAAGGSRRITHYIRSPWGNANYTAPYAVVVDAPRLVAEDMDGGPGSANGLRPNPLPVRVYLDNVGGYATINQEIPLSSVRVTLSLSQGLSLAPGEVAIKTINSVPARQIRFVDFLIMADGIAVGDLPYSIKVEPVPGPTKILNGTIRVASTPRLVIKSDANLITAPWTFGDTAWETILAPLVSPADFQAFNWDPQQQGYVISTSVERGKAAWIISNSDEGSIPLGGNPQRPADTAVGGHSIQLKSGWNLIGNPYNYAIKVGEIVGVSAATPQQAFTWQQLVNQGVVSGALVYYDNETQDYVYTQGLDAPMFPNRGYWVFVATAQDVTLSYPAVYAEFLPGSSRRQEEGRWVQSDKQWRLNLTARTNKSLDAQNFVGAARNAAEAKKLKFVEAPMTPIHNVGLAIQETVNGETRNYAQSLSEKSGRKEWKAIVTSTEAGTVSLSWPNVTTVPKNVRFRITDLSTGTSRDLRQISGYSFEATANSTREFKIEAIPGGVSQVVIGSINIGRANSRDVMSPFTINYTLSNDATTTVRILSGSGKEVFMIARGRADKAGENTAVWALRDNANRAVAPGSYRVEILAETPTGERVRRVAAINVIR